MTKRINTLTAACAVLAIASGVHSTLRAQGGTSAADGVYSEAQAKRGATLYAEQCASCHGEDMSGIADLFPALTGDAFMMNWRGKSVGELFDKISMTMPALDPGSLKPEQAADLIADILSKSKYPAGATDLASSLAALQQIRIDPPKP